MAKAKKKAAGTKKKATSKPVVDAVKATKICLPPGQPIIASKPARRKKTVLILLPEEKFEKLDKSIRDPDELLAATKALRTTRRH